MDPQRVPGKKNRQDLCSEAWKEILNERSCDILSRSQSISFPDRVKVHWLL